MKQLQLIGLKKISIVIAASSLAFPALSYAQSNSAGAPHKMTMPMAEPSTANGMDLMAAMTKMRSQMDSMKMSGNVDDDFAMMMRAHHQGAIDMAKAELSSGKDAELRKMAQKTIDDQTKEIAKLDKWIAKKGHSMK